MRIDCYQDNSPPDASGLPPHLVLAAEGAGVLGVLGDLHLLHGLPQGGSVPGAVFTGDSDLLGALGHLKGFFCKGQLISKESFTCGALNKNGKSDKSTLYERISPKKTRWNSSALE